MTLKYAEQNITATAAALGIDLDLPAPLEAAMKRRAATEALRGMQRRDPAAEIRECTNPRRFESLLTEIGQHNLLADAAREAITGGAHGAAITGAEMEWAQFAPEFADQAADTLGHVINDFCDAARNVRSLDPTQAVARGFGDDLTRLHVTGRTLTMFAECFGTRISGTAKTGAQLAALIAPDAPVQPLRMTITEHRGQVSEVVNSPVEVDQRNIARQLIADWRQDSTDTLRKVARGEYIGYSLLAATSEDYAGRAQSFSNADRTERVTAPVVSA